MIRTLNTPLKRSGINWVVCAAGKSERFKAAHVLTPKPLIKLKQISMLERAISALELLDEDRLIIVTQKTDRITQQISQRLTSLYPWVDVRFVELEDYTSGQLETALRAEKHLRKDAGIAIWNCDTFFSSAQLTSQLRNLAGVDGIIPCARAKGTSWSFVNFDAEGIATEIAEKVAISNWATVGLYFFSDTQAFLRRAKNILRSQTKRSELYVSHLYAQLIAEGQRFKIVNCDVFLPFGTPDQVRQYWGVPLKQLIADNPPGTIVVDLDNTLTIDDKELSYAHKKPRRDVIKQLRAYKERGFRIIIHTARNMQTQHNDEAMVIGNIGAVTIAWLAKHKVPYDGLRFGKPYARDGFYVDDKGIRPQEFLQHTFDELIELTA